MINRQIQELDKELGKVGQEDPQTKRLMTIPGVGATTAVAVSSWVGDIAVARMELHDAQIEEIDIEGVLGICGEYNPRCASLVDGRNTRSAPATQKVLFPKGVTYSHQTGFGTTETSLFFRWLALVQEKKDGLALI